MPVATHLNAAVRGRVDGEVLVLLHGFGCGQEMWRLVAPALERDHRVVTFDLPGSGAADPAAYDAVRHGSLEGYRDDVVALLDELDLTGATLVGHSVSSMIAVLVQAARPDLVSRLVLVAPSARYLDDDGYVGGFAEADIADLLALMGRNHLGWQDPLARLVAGTDGDVKHELEQSFCRTRPEVAEQFAAVTFRGDNRDDLAAVTVPTLVLQARDDVVAPMSAGRFVADTIPGATFEVIDTRGHCPHLTAPDETTRSIQRFLTTAG
ncbi:alpha/beta hydrolase [Nocardioides marinquilinus]|uniref:Alpha/beta hydrolase n=1 Tax=Nocardioides marinquilinus TaxID=1210400 RepID=A0ABP9PV04_9ACTN